MYTLQQLGLTRTRMTFIALAAMIILLAGFTFAFAGTNYQTNSWHDSNSYSQSGYGWSGGNTDYSHNTNTMWVFEADLKGSEEVPPVSAGTTGNAKVSMGNQGNDMQYWLSLMNGNDITAAHLHCARRGVTGPVVATLFSDSAGRDINGALASGSIANAQIMDSDCTAKIGFDIVNIADLARAIKEGYIYVNVHSKQYPDGVARGQLAKTHSGADWNDTEDWRDSAEKYWWNNKWWHKNTNGTWYDTDNNTWDGNSNNDHHGDNNDHGYGQGGHDDNNHSSQAEKYWWNNKMWHKDSDGSWYDDRGSKWNENDHNDNESSYNSSNDTHGDSYEWDYDHSNNGYDGKDGDDGRKGNENWGDWKNDDNYSDNTSKDDDENDDWNSYSSRSFDRASSR